MFFGLPHAVPYGRTGMIFYVFSVVILIVDQVTVGKNSFESE